MTSRAPAAGCLRISASSSSVSGPDFPSTCGRILTLPTSCSGAAQRRERIRSRSQPSSSATGSASAATRSPWPMVWSRSSSARAIEASMPERIPRPRRDSYFLQMPPLGVPLRERARRRARTGGLEPVFQPFLPVMHEQESDKNRHGDSDRGVDAVPLDRIRRGSASVVGDEPDGRRPADTPGGVPEEELPPRHPRNARCPGGREAENADEATEEDDLAAV